jgi:hypothetical protein
MDMMADDETIWTQILREMRTISRKCLMTSIFLN